ncbi:hypothetical protein DFR65_10986 [Oceanihabitans sediminis]|uniref:Uncharacterized protein n=1 Tax=Oceanihabitans sediminis TaxID=1812012 RepID=A0A368P1Y8_9FLAO|nr:hypothetical protein [Oceanihabitans sediminis]RBP27695.1 hypothetical protein DFR65_10986 [Oceanihabitans sediminis]RCU56416.1 hypothetical protein DU428_12590 [Oceanihabitans sediminis]
MQFRKIILFFLSTILLLLLPLIAMQFTKEVNWTTKDFIVAGTLIFGAATISEILSRKIKNPKHKITLIITVLAMIILVWIELAVGIFSKLVSDI